MLIEYMLLSLKHKLKIVFWVYFFSFCLPPLRSFCARNVRGTEERLDLCNFLCVDSIRGKFLFADGKNQKKIMELDDFDKSLSIMFELPSINADFLGAIRNVKVLPDNNYLIYEYLNEQCDRLWKLDPEKKTMKRVFTLRNKYQLIRFNWGIEYNPYEKILYMSEYGNSSDNPIDPENPNAFLGRKAGATRIWYSKDYGDTWKVFYDFKIRDDVQEDYFHIHAIHFDTFDHCLYVSTGDGWVIGEKSNKKLFCFKKDEAHPHVYDFSYYWGTSNDAYSHPQIISMFAAEDFILAGGDDFQNCIYLISKKSLEDGGKLEVVWKHNKNVSGLITQYTQRFKKLSNGMIITLLGNGDGNGYPCQTRLIGTCDGYFWQTLYEGQYEEQSMDIYNEGVFEEWNGFVFFMITRNVDGRKENVFVKIPIRNIPKFVSRRYAKDVYFDESGKSIDRPTKGIYIQHTGEGKIKKVYIDH